jgi:hypothetical protein
MAVDPLQRIQTTRMTMQVFAFQAPMLQNRLRKANDG